MKKARNILRLCLFIVGILFQFASFFVSRVEQVPWVIWFINPTYVRAQLGLRTLDSQKPLNPGDKGFPEIQSIVMKWLRQENPPEARDAKWIMGFKFVPISRMVTGQTVVFDTKQLHVFLSNGQDLEIDAARLRNDLEGVRKRSIFYSSLSFLIAGIVIVQIPLFFIRSAPCATNGPERQTGR